jgi:DNA ligase-1
MPSPAKKRKINEAEAPQQRMRSIESFFQGQATKRAKKAEESQTNTPSDNQGILSDEALARRLQA